MSLNQLINPVAPINIKSNELIIKTQNGDSLNLSSLPNKGEGGQVLASDGDGTVSWIQGTGSSGVDYNGDEPVVVGTVAIYGSTNGKLIKNSIYSESNIFNKNGDIMNGNITMDGNNIYSVYEAHIDNLSSAVSNEIHVMSDLDMNGNNILNSNLVTYNGNIPAVVGSLAIINQVNGKIIKNSSITESQVSGAISSISSIESDITNLQTQTLNLSSDGAGLSSILGTLNTGTLNATNINCDNIISLSTIRTIAPGHTISEPGRYRISLTHTNTVNLFSINYNNWCSIYNAYFTSVSPIGTINIWIVAVNVAYLENQVNEQAIANVTQIGGTPRPSELSFSVSGTGPYNSMVTVTPAPGAGTVTSTYEFSIIYG